MQQQRPYQPWALVSLSVLAVGITMAMVQYKVPTIMTSIMGLYDMDAGAASWLMSIFTLMMVFSAIAFGALSQKVSAKWIIAGATALIVIGSLIGAWAPDGVILLVSRALEGIALTAMTTCGPIVIQQCVRPERIGSAMGFWGTWGPLGSAIAAVTTPVIFATMGLSALWMIYAALVTITTIVLCLYVKMRPAPDATVIEEEGEEVILTEHLVEMPRYGELMRRDVLLFFGGFIAFNIVLLAVLSYVPTLLQMRGMDPTLSGFASTLPMILSVISSPIFGALADKTGKTKVLTAFCLFFLGPCAFMMYVFDGGLMWGAAIVMGLIGMGSTGLMITAFMRVLPRPQLAQIGMGVLITVQGIGQFLGTFLVQMLLGPDLSNIWLAGSVIMVLGLLGTLCVASCRMKG